MILAFWFKDFMHYTIHLKYARDITSPVIRGGEYEEVIGLSVIKIPDGDYSEEALKIMSYPSAQSIGFDVLLLASSNEHLNEALAALKNAQNAKARIERIKRELRLRELGDSKESSEAWKKKFAEEWNNVRRSARKL